MTAAIEIGDDLAALDAAIEALPNSPAVFLLWPREGEPYLSQTSLLRRRLLRLLKEREKPSRLLNLRHTVRRIEYRLHRVGLRIEPGAVRTGAAAFPGELSRPDQAAHAALRARSCSATNFRAATSPPT